MKVTFKTGSEANYGSTNGEMFFASDTKQLLLNGVKYIPKKLSELTNDSGFLTSITKSMVEGVLTGNITSHTHSYLPLTGGTLTGNLICNGSYINMNSARGAKGYRGYFNNSQNADRAAGSHIFQGTGWAYGTNATSIGLSAYAGIRNTDSDNETYPYLHWQWMNCLQVQETTSGTAVNCYGAILTNAGGNKDTATFSLCIDDMCVAYGMAGNSEELNNFLSFTNTNASTGRVVVYIANNKSGDANERIFAGTTSRPRSQSNVKIGNVLLGQGCNINDVASMSINGVTVYRVAFYFWSKTLSVSYDITQKTTAMVCAKVNDTNYSGASSYASGYSSVASGSYSVASGASSVASGYYSVASGTYSVASGTYSVASGTYSVASGSHSVASGSYSVASGNSSVASGTYSVASGYSSVASGSYSVASGASSVASGYSSVASGYSSVASGSYSVASGASSVASHDFSIVLAQNGKTQSSYQTIIGRYNAKVAGLFIIGNGSSNARSNALVVDESGNVTAKYFSGYANAVGGEGFKIYPENTNQINFGGTGSDTTVVFGAASKDSRSVPTTYKFGADGKAILEGLARRLAYTAIPENADINTYINEGVYSTTKTSIMRSLVNAPTNRLNGEMRLEVISSSSSTISIIQKFWSRDAFSGWKLHIRTIISNGWTAWKQIALTDSSITGNAATASKLANQKKITVGGASEYFDGSKDISFDLDKIITNTSHINVGSINVSDGLTSYSVTINNHLELGTNADVSGLTPSKIGAAAASHTHQYAASPSVNGAATWLYGKYTNNGGRQNPNYFGTLKVGALMMNTVVNGNTQYKDWIISDCYTGSDAGGAVAFGVNRQSLGAYIMRSAAERTEWAESAELLGTHNYTKYAATKDHTHLYAGSSSAGGAATSAVKLNTSRKLWGQSFDGSADVYGNIYLYSSNMEVATTRGIREFSLSGFIGFVNPSVGDTDKFSGICLGWANNPTSADASLRINSSTFTYKGNTVWHGGNLKLGYTSSGLSRAVQKDSSNNLYVVAPSLFEQGISNNYPKNLRWSNETEGQLVYDKEIEAGNFDTVEIGIPLADGTSKGFLKSTSTVTNVTGYTPCPVVSGTPYYKYKEDCLYLGSTEIGYTGIMEYGIQHTYNYGTKLPYLEDYTPDSIPRCVVLCFPDRSSNYRFLFWLSAFDDADPYIARFYNSAYETWLTIDTTSRQIILSYGNTWQS